MKRHRLSCTRIRLVLRSRLGFFFGTEGWIEAAMFVGEDGMCCEVGMCGL